MKKLSYSDAELKKSVAFKKKRVLYKVGTDPDSDPEIQKKQALGH